MPTPLTPDEEFDALFRQGLEHYPEQPDDLAAWQRMDLLLDAHTRQRALRRRVWRLLSAEVALLLLGTWLVVHWAATRWPADRPLAGTSAEVMTKKQAALPPSERPHAGALASTAGGSAPVAPGLRAAGSAALASRATATTTARSTTAVGAATAAGTSPELPGGLPATRSLAASAQRTAGQATSHERAVSALLANSQRRAVHRRTVQPDLAALPTTAPASRLARMGQPADLAAQTSRHPTHRAGVGTADKPASALTKQIAQVAQPRQAAQRHGTTALSAAARHKRLPLAAALPTTSAATSSKRAEVEALDSELLAPAGSFDPLAARYPSGIGAALLPDSLAGVALAAWPRPVDSLIQSKPVVAWQAYRLRVGVMASPELNSVRASRLTAPGGDVGLQLDYQLAPRWHLNASYLLTLKRYVARGTDYNLPAGYVLPHNWVISDVDAVCRIVDIPVNLRYDVLRKQRYQLFASAGLSSLLMRREQYTYGYEPVAGQPVAPYSWELDNGSNHILKILNLSAGYERAVGPRWTVQAEPYLKLPLGGVGFGAVRLMSVGVFFSFKYGLLPAHPATPAAP